MSKKFPFNGCNAFQQNFCLPKPIINYIIKASNGVVMKKLYRTCKYFYMRNPFCIVDEIECKSKGKVRIDGEWFESNNIPKIYNILVLNSFNLRSYQKSKNFINKIVRSNAKTIKIAGEKWPIDVFKMLTKSGKVKSWKSKDAYFIDKDGSHLSLETFLSALSGAEKIKVLAKVGKVKDYCSTIKPLNENKIKSLSFCVIDFSIDSEDFYKFLQKSLAPKASIEVCFSYGNYKQDSKKYMNFREELKKKVELWQPIEEKPNLTFAMRGGILADSLSLL